MAILGFEIEELQRLISLVDEQGLKELIIDEDGKYIRIKGVRHGGGNLPQVITGQKLIPAYQPTRAIVSPEESIDENVVALESPVVAVFYRAEKPGAPPMVNVGDHVTEGQTVGILEAMKVFSELKAEQSGRVISFPVKDGELVQTGQVLLLLRKD